MLEINTIYELYIENINHKINKLLYASEPYLEAKVILEGILKKYENVINRHCNIKYNDILVTKRNTKITFPNYTIYDKGMEIKTKAVSLYINNYINNNIVLNNNVAKIKILKKQIIPKKVYLDTIKYCNLSMIDKIVNTNYLFKPTNIFGSIGVYKVTNKRLRVNWGASDKNKQRILAEGKIPYIKKDAETIPNYQGVEWLVYHPALDFYIHWVKTSTGIRTNPEMKFFKFTPARAGQGKVSFVSKLQDVKDDREKALQLYTRTAYSKI